jgi:hypothetical protein
MKQPINEIRRMQQLAGLIKEGQLNEDIDVTYDPEEGDGVDSRKAIEFIKQTVRKEGYNIPNEIFDDMYNAAYDANFLSIYRDKPLEYYKTFNIKKAMETARKYIDDMIEDGDLDAESIEDFRLR